MLTAERLRELLHYDPLTGVFTWRVKTSSKSRVEVGSVAGYTDSKGYLVVTVDGCMYLAHRLAHLYMIGEWPLHHIDHRDGDPLCNRWANLRPATRSENMQNQRRAHQGNVLGILGVSRSRSKYKAQIRVNGKRRYLGTFDTEKEADAAYLAAKKVLHPFASCDTIQHHFNPKGKDVYTITLEYQTLEEAITALATLRNPETAPKPDVKVKTEKAVTAPKPASDAMTVPSASGKQGVEAGQRDASEKRAKEPSASATGDASADPYAPVGALIKKLAATHRAQVLATLTEFKAANGKELKPEQYAGFIEKLEAAVSSLD